MAAKVAAEVAVVATEATVESLNIQDSLIDAAEIQAAYLNTNTILSQNCVIEGDIANLQADSDLDSLKLSIEPTDDSKTTFLVLSAERGVEAGIDLVIDCYDETEEMYQTQLFTRTEISEGTTLVKFPKHVKDSKSSKKSREGKEAATKSVASEVLQRRCHEAVFRSTRTVIIRRE